MPFRSLYTLEKYKYLPFSKHFWVHTVPGTFLGLGNKAVNKLEKVVFIEFTIHASGRNSNTYSNNVIRGYKYYEEKYS